MTTSKSADPGAFRAFEHAGWLQVAEQYNNFFASLTGQTIGPLLDAAGVTNGARLLDVATGPGYVAAAAAQRGASALGLDFSAAMVALARRQYPEAEFREGDAEQLPFPDGSFDAVVTNFGLLHLATPEKALMEAHRVLRPGGRIGFTVWARPDEAIGFQIILQAIEQHGATNAPLPEGPPFFRFSDPAECHRVLQEAGFVAPRTVQVPQVWRLASPDALLDAMQEGTVRTGGLLLAQPREAQNAIQAAIRDAVKVYEKAGSIELPMAAVLATARKP
ncbi:MAG: methyltransferase domain-containing protein [Acidobacteria bacterium]|nr:methyltransferase domain-containing protein [Acidobacteriota bacterium]